MRDSDPVVIVIDEQEIELVAPRGKRREKQRFLRWPSRLGGIVLTVVVHLLVSVPLVLGTAAHKQRPSPDGIGTTTWASQGDQNASMMLIDLSSMSASADLEAMKSTPAENSLTDLPPLMLVSYEATPPPELEIDDTSISEEANEAAGDPTGNAAMFGKYMGQVAARIDRAWMRPRSPIDSGHFDCRVSVTQDSNGVVLNVSLDNCGEDVVWKRSLESAILRASPLSAPPEPWLFTPTLSLNFSAEQYERGVTPEYFYEPELVRVAANENAVQIFATPEDEVSPIQALGKDAGDVELTISGSQVTWKKKSRAMTR